MSAGPHASPSFAPDQLVGGRYRVTRFLGQGASGEVYAAEDRELGTTVALKLLRPGIASDPHSIERFKREILLARRVSHPNVCRLFDLGLHESGGAAGGRPMLFLTMELLDGETLARRLAEAGPMPPDEALPIVRQLARALDAAHAAGVVHRDFKSANIVLVPEAGGERAVVTDFGLARSERPSSAGAVLTEAGGLLGTPAYMAPEQVAGRPASPASDLYALGVVLYEMVTGALPFGGETPLEVAVKRLREPPTPPEVYRRELPARWREAILRCLDREPERRFRSAEEVVRSLDPETMMLPRPRPEGSRRRWGIVAAIFATLLIGAAVTWQVRRGGESGSSRQAARASRRSIAVLAFANATERPESAWLSAALAEMLTSELAAGGAVRAIPGEVVAQARRDLGLAPRDALGAETLAKLRRILGADWVLLGSYTALGERSGGRLRLDVRLQETAGGELEALRVEGAEAAIFDLVRDAGEQLRRKLVAGGVVAAAGESAARPASAEALRLYSEGLEALRSSDPLGARERLERAVAADPVYPLAQAALARAWSELGYDSEALAAAERAARLSDSLPRAERLTVQALERRLSRDWPRAIALARELREGDPTDLELGLRLAEVELEAGDATSALAVLEELVRLPPPAGEDPRIDLLVAQAAEALSDFHRQLAAAEAAAGKAESSGARSVAARAELAWGTALRRLGETTVAAEHLERAVALATELGDRAQAAVAAQALANLERSRGDFVAAERRFEEARATFAAIGNRRREARARLSLGLVASERGDLVRARQLYEEAHATLAELGDRRAAAAALANIGTMLYLGWDLAGAERRHEEALAEFRALADRTREVVALANLGQIRRERGDLAASDRFWTEALELARSTGDRSGEASALFGLGENRELAGDRDGARKLLEESAALCRQIDQEHGAAVAELSLARLDRDGGKPAEAFSTFRRLAADFAARDAADERLQAELEAARSLVRQRGKEGAASAALADLGPELAATPNLGLAHLGHLVSAEIDLALGRRQRARQTLEEDLALARRAGHRLGELEDRLGLLSLSPTARARDQIVSEARRAGFEALAGRAAALAPAR